MTKRQPLCDILTEEQKRECIDAIIAHFGDAYDEQIGMVAEQLITAGYNSGVEAAKKTLGDSITDIQVNMELLRK